MTKAVLLYERIYHEGPLHRKLHYYLLIDEVRFGSNVLDIYGARVMLYENGRLTGEKTLRGLTPFGPKINVFLQRFADSLSTPNTMERMLEQPKR